MKALIVCHETAKDSGIIPGILERRGFDVETVLGYHDKLPGIDPLAHDLAVVMGGPMGVYQADIFPYLNSEIAYLQKRLSADRPTLGICLGAQLMAKALGKNVYPGPQGKEIGWLPIDVKDKTGPTRHLDASLTRMMQWHGDTFDLPEGATLLASSELYQYQIYTYGKKAMALQCHLEVTGDILEEWMASGYNMLEQNGSSVPQLRADTAKHLATLNKQATLFLNEWLDKVMA